MSHSDKANVQETRGVVRLNLKRDDVRARSEQREKRESSDDSAQGTDEPVDLEFTHEQLSAFFQQLQTIQKQLDALR
jgi:hypothetical protein